MIQKKKHKDRAKFTGRKQSKRGCIGFAVVILAVVSLAALLYFDITAGGKAGIAIGCLGVCSMLFSFGGLAMEIRALAEEDIYKVIPVTGTILGTICLICFVGIYVMGFTL